MQDKMFGNMLNDRNVIVILCTYIFFVLLTCSNMSPMYYSNEWADVNIYFNIGKAIFNGRTLYTEAFDHKGPLIFFIYGFGYIISNDSFLGMFFIQVMAWIAMACSIYYLAKLYLSKAYACMVALIFPIFLIDLMKTGGSAEEFILVAECVSLYLFVKYFKDKDASLHKPSHMLIHGIMCSVVLFIKINLIIFWFFPLAGIFLNLLLKKEYRNFIINAVIFLAGLLIIALPICIYLYVNGALEEAYNIYIELNRRYADIQTLPETLLILLGRISFLFIKPISLFLLASLGIFYFPVRYIENRIGKWVMVMSGLSLYVVIFMAKVFQYYYPIPFLVYAVLGLLGIFIVFDRHVKTIQCSFKYMFLFAVIMYYVAFSHGNVEETRIYLYIRERPELLMQNIHDVIVEEENPTLLNLGFGLGNSLFTTCNIMPNVRYFISPNLTYESYPQLRDEQEEYIKNKVTQFVLIQREETPLSGCYKRKKGKKNDKEKEGKLGNRKINNQKYFESLPIFHANYELVLTDTIVNSIDEKGIDVYALYKRRD